MSVGSSVLTSLKNKMQALRDELDKTRDILEEKDRELDQEKAERAVVGFQIKFVKVSFDQYLILSFVYEIFIF